MTTKLVLAIVVVLFVSPTPANEIKVSLDFERMKLRSDYLSDLNRATKEGQLFILWISHEDLKLYHWLKVNCPEAVHCFVKAQQLQDVQPGVIVGIRRKAQVEQAKALSVFKLNTLKTEEVIPYSLGLPPGSLASYSNPLSGRGAPEESLWTGFRH